ncbi:hypothetical protein VUR80DRAFT_7107 [Thermomyces stellatus]
MGKRPKVLLTYLSLRPRTPSVFRRLGSRQSIQQCTFAVDVSDVIGEERTGTPHRNRRVGLCRRRQKKKNQKRCRLKELEIGNNERSAGKKSGNFFFFEKCKRVRMAGTGVEHWTIRRFHVAPTLCRGSCAWALGWLTRGENPKASANRRK